ncbi:MAG: extracellular solute-binding protein [Acetobacteraceae bacterium]
MSEVRPQAASEPAATPGRRGFMMGALPVLAAPVILASRARAATRHTLRYWSFLDPASKDPRSRAQSQMIAGFQAKNPDIAIRIEVVHWSKIVPLLNTSAAAGQAPDLALIHSSRIPQAADAGAIVPIDAFIDAMPQAEQADFLEPLAKMRYQGHIWSLPAEHRIEGMLLYRTDLFAKAGITRPPRTFAELAEVAGKLNQPHVWGFVWALSRKDAAANVKILQTEYWAAGGDFFKPDGTANVNSPIGLKLADALADLAFKRKVMPARPVGVEEARSMMKGGTAAILVEGTQVFNSIASAKAVGPNLATAPLPTLEAGQYPPDALLAGQTLAISKDCKARDAAWRFIDYMTHPAAQLVSATVGGSLPVRKSVFKDAWFATPAARQMVGWRDYILAKGRPFLVSTLSDYMNDCLGLAYEEILTRSATPRVALEQAAARFNERKRSTN